MLSLLILDTSAKNILYYKKILGNKKIDFLKNPHCKYSLLTSLNLL